MNEREPRPKLWPGIAEFVAAHEDELEKATGIGAPADAWEFALNRLRENFWGDVSIYHDDHSRFAQGVLNAYMRGEPVKDADLRAAVYDLYDRARSATYANHRLKESLVNCQRSIRRNYPR